MAPPIRTVVIAGGGLDGWFTALSLSRRLPGVAVTVIEEPGAALQPADLYAGTRPAFRRTLEKLNLSPPGLAAEAGGVVRLGQLYDGWSGADARFAHCFGRYGTRIGQAPFHQAWLRARRNGEAAPLDLHSTAVMLAQSGRITEPSDDEYSPLALFDYGWSYEPGALTHTLRMRALADGVTLRRDRIAAVTRQGGHIGTLRLESGELIAADLFIDCTGPAARLLEALDVDGREHWSVWLRADRIQARRQAGAASLQLVDTATLEDGGWRLRVPLRQSAIELRIGRSAVPRDPGSGWSEEVALPQGRRRRFWIGNCLALGDAAATLEPLGAPGLHLLALEIDRLLWFLPDSACDPVETGEYNRRVALEVDRVRDFAILHHALAADAGTEPPLGAPLPQPLADTLALFRERGKIPGREGESAELDDWLAVLLGHGIMPDHFDPALDEVPPETFRRTSAAIRALIAEAVRNAPPHAAFLTRRA